MDSYIDLKNKIEDLQEQIEKIQNYKSNIIMPLYEIIDKNKDRLEGVLPKNINAINPKTLILRIDLIEAEIKDLELDEETQRENLNIIHSIKENIIEKNKEQAITKVQINDLNYKLDRRKNYVLEKITEINNSEMKIKELEKQIEKYNNILGMDEWEQSINIAITNVINKYFNELKEENNKLEEIYNEKKLKEDIEFLNPKKQEEIQNEIKIEEEIVEIPAIEQLEEDNKKEEFQNEDLINPTTEKVVEEVSKEETNVDEFNFEVEEVSIGETEEDSFEDEEEQEKFSIIDKTRNWLLEQKLIFKKKDRIALGVSSLLSKMKEKYQEHQEMKKTKKEFILNEEEPTNEEIIVESQELINNVVYLVDNHLSKLTQEEVNYIVKTASKLKLKIKDMNESKEEKEEDIAMLKQTNIELSEYLRPINMTIRTIEQEAKEKTLKKY